MLCIGRIIFSYTLKLHYPSSLGPSTLKLERAISRNISYIPHYLWAFGLTFFMPSCLNIICAHIQAIKLAYLCFQIKGVINICWSKSCLIPVTAFIIKKKRKRFELVLWDSCHNSEVSGALNASLQPHYSISLIVILGEFHFSSSWDKEIFSSSNIQPEETIGSLLFYLQNIFILLEQSKD